MTKQTVVQAAVHLNPKRAPAKCSRSSLSIVIIVSSGLKETYVWLTIKTKIVRSEHAPKIASAYRLYAKWIPQRGRIGAPQRPAGAATSVTSQPHFSAGREPIE